MATAAQIWRDFVTDGISSSGAHKPIKSEIRAWGAIVEQGAGLSPGTTVSAPGDFTVTNETYLRIKKTTPATTKVFVPASAARSGDLVIKDAAGNAGTFQISIVPAGVEDIDGFNAPGGYPLGLNYGLVRLRPRTGGYDVV